MALAVVYVTGDSKQQYIATDIGIVHINDSGNDDKDSNVCLST